MPTCVVNLRSTSFDVYIGREGHGYDGTFGNPFSDEDKPKAVRRYKDYFLDRVEKDHDFKAKVMALQGKKLGCFCRQPGGLCHGNVIVEYLEQFEADNSDWFSSIEG